MADNKYESVAAGECEDRAFNTTVTEDDIAIPKYSHPDAKCDEIWCKFCGERIRSIPPANGELPPAHNDLLVLAGAHGRCHEKLKRETISKRRAAFAKYFGRRSWYNGVLAAVASALFNLVLFCGHLYILVAVVPVEAETTFALLSTLAGASWIVFVETCGYLKQLASANIAEPSGWMVLYKSRGSGGYLTGFMAIVWLGVGVAASVTACFKELFIGELVLCLIVPLVITLDIAAWCVIPQVANYLPVTEDC